nr:TetR/AcrR family transcriptional regulator [Nocardia transvalensis]
MIEAGVQVIGTEGVKAFGMRAVCREAGLSQKFFYESFPDTDALLHAVYRAALARLDEATAAANDLHGVIDAAARLMEADPRICRILLVEPVADTRLRHYVRETIPSVVAARLGTDFGSPDDPLVRMRFSGFFGAVISLFVEWTEGSLGTDRDAFVRHVAGIAAPLLTASGGPATRSADRSGRTARE